MRTQFEEDLNLLHENFIQMGEMVNLAIEKAVTAFIDHDKTKAKEVIAEDHQINEEEINLEKKSFEMIALQQPVTTDLRRIVTVLKASSDLERMADHAVSIAKSTIHVKGQTRVLEIEEAIGTMSHYVEEMVAEVLQAYIHIDVEKAKEIANSDDRVNESFHKIYNRCILEMEENPATVVGATDYVMVASYLERIGDYVTNICEWIVYIATGKMLELNSNVKEELF